jgi:predicted amidophosphoribosyltransferase
MLNRSALASFWGSVFLSPFAVFVYLLFAGKGGKVCPKCAEYVKKEAVKCKHCGHEFSLDNALPDNRS